MDINEVIKNIDGIDEKFKNLILKYYETYVNMSSNKTLTAENFISQLKSKLERIEYKKLDGISGCVDNTGTTLTISDDTEYWYINNTFLHELTHLLARNEYSNGVNRVQPNCGLKVGRDNQMEFSIGFRLTNWETDGNNYAYNQGILLFDEWVTEWLANKISELKNVEVREDKNGFFRKKTSHGYDGSNIMSMLELVYGSENIANLLTGFDLEKEERKCVIPIKEFHKLNQMIDSNIVLSNEEIAIFKNLYPPYMKTPNITGLITYYMSEYCNQETLEDYNVYLQKMLNVLIRTYSISFNNKLNNCNNIEETTRLYNELLTIQNAMIWTKDLETLKSLESYQLFNQMRNNFASRIKELNFDINKFADLYLTPEQLYEKFKHEEKEIKDKRYPFKMAMERINIFEPEILNELITLPNGKSLTIDEYLKINRVWSLIPLDAEVHIGVNDTTMSGQDLIEAVIQNVKHYNNLQDFFNEYDITVNQKINKEQEQEIGSKKDDEYEKRQEQLREQMLFDGINKPAIASEDDLAKKRKQIEDMMSGTFEPEAQDRTQENDYGISR